MKRNLIAGVIISVSLILVGSVYWFGIHTEDLEISIVFDNAEGVGKDTKIVFKKVPVGEISEVKVRDNKSVVVDARIYKEYKEKVNSSSAFIIESPGPTLESDKKQISVEVLNEDASPFSQGVEVEGYSSRSQFFVRTSRRILESAYEQFNNWLGEFQRGLKDLSEHERLEALKRNMQELMDEARRSAGKGLEELNKEIPHLKEELNNIIEELKRLGKDREADEFRDEFDIYLKELENKAREAGVNGLSTRLYA
jgi:paraquat-inducible protein B